MSGASPPFEVLSVAAGPLRVAMITNSVPQYRLPIYRALAESGHRTFHWFLSDSERYTCREARDHLQITFVRGVKWTKRMHHEAVKSLQVEPSSIPIALPRDLWRYRPDVIVSSDFGVRAVLAFAYARARRIPFVLSSEETPASAAGRSTTQQLLRRAFARRSDAALAWGEPARQYLLALGADPDRTIAGVQPVDVDRLEQLSSTLDRVALRRTLGVPGRTLLLVGRLLHLKGFHLFIDAWSRVPRAARADWSVLLVGEGPERVRLAELANRLVPGEIRFEGFRQGDALWNYFAIADAFVMPSLVDVWGLVINEALSFGVPVIGSRYAGAAQQLLERPECGEVIDPADVQAFATTLTRWLTFGPQGSPESRRAVVRAHNFMAAAAAIQAAIDVAVSRQPSKLALRRSTWR